MKEFDLEAAKAGKKVMTRNGHKAKIVCYDYKGHAPLLVIVENKNRELLSGNLRQYVQEQTAESVYEYYESGKVCAPHLNSNIASDLSLVMATEKYVGWVNIYYDNATAKAEMYHEIYATEEIARHQGQFYDWIATVKVEWEE